jgi:GTP-binding protein
MGRPNVGKSTLINRLIGKKKAITLDVPGVTRDLAEFQMDWNGKPFLIVDSGGVLFHDSDEMQSQIEMLVVQELERADKIVFVVDGIEGVHPYDKDIAQLLRPYDEKVILAVNKVDDGAQLNNAGEFYALGLGTPNTVSAFHGSGLGDVLDLITESMKPTVYDSEVACRVAIVGRPNVGKSSLLNAILNEHRVIVDNQAGTTRDSIETQYAFYGKNYTLVDTAGIRKQSKVEDGIEYYSVIRSFKAVDQADVVVMVINPDMWCCEQDKKIMNYVIAAKKSMVIWANKWDLTERTELLQKEFIAAAIRQMPPLENYPFIFGSATEKIHLTRLLEWIPRLYDHANTRVSTSSLNQFIEDVIKRNPPPTKYNERVTVYYATQVRVNPPQFVFFVNKAENIGNDYQRFVENRMRERYDFLFGCSLELGFKSRRKVMLDPKIRRARKR